MDLHVKKTATSNKEDSVPCDNRRDSPGWMIQQSVNGEMTVTKMNPAWAGRLGGKVTAEECFLRVPGKPECIYDSPYTYKVQIDISPPEDAQGEGD